MKLVAEQIKVLRERKKELEESIRHYREGAQEREKTSIDGVGLPFLGDFQEDMAYANTRREFHEIEKQLGQAEFVTERNYNAVDIGTAFYVNFGDDDRERLMLIDENISNGGYKLVSTKSDFGKAVIGKREGETVTYTVQATGRKLSLTIDEIDTIRENYEHFIRETEQHNRLCHTAKEELRQLKENNPEEYANRHTISKSQWYLANEEYGKFGNQSKSKADIKRKSYLRDILANAKIAELPKDDTIGIGSKVEVLITDENGNTKTKQFEYVNQAISTELESQYVERITAEGRSLFGLKANDTFKIKRKNKPALMGIVLSVKNYDVELGEKRVK